MNSFFISNPQNSERVLEDNWCLLCCVL